MQSQFVDRLLESKTFLAFLICLAIALALMVAAVLARAFYGADLPYVRDLLEWLLRAFGILAGRNVISDGLPRVLEAARRNGDGRGLDALQERYGGETQ